MADPYGNYQSNQGLLSGPALNPKGIDPELLRADYGPVLSQTSPTPGWPFLLVIWVTGYSRMLQRQVSMPWAILTV
jgi:hypothetical protein